MKIDAKDMFYKDLNEVVRRSVEAGEKDIELVNVNGQRYIGTGIDVGDVTITVNGVPGNDLAAFLNGPTIVVKANAQDGVANTMNQGRVHIHGDAGDILGYSMRGGRVFVKGDVGYRVGIHMKGFGDQVPAIVAGGCAGDFLGEYMAGGVLVLLGLNRPDGTDLVGDFCASGIHGGAIFLRGMVESHRIGAEAGLAEPDEQDTKILERLVGEYCEAFGVEPDEVFARPFVKLYPQSSRPYGKLYAY